MSGLFITGTNTGVGKTHVTAMIARQLVKEGCRVGVYKPVASGCIWESGALVAEDALLLWDAAGKPGDFKYVCPQCFAEPLAPPQAAAAEGRKVDRDLLRSGLDYWIQHSDFVLVEGAGGLMSPISDEDVNADLAVDLGLPLLIVSSNELGTINGTLQTVITAQTIAPSLRLAGIVLNQTSLRSDDPSTRTNAADIADRCDVPLLEDLAFRQQELTRAINWMALAKP